MHIPDSMLQGAVCPVTATISTISVVGATYFGMKAKEKPTAVYFAAITSLIFALQMINFPINSGTSGHLLGGVLASSLLGLPFGILSIAVVVTIQSLIFSDGGLTVLGSNVINMAVLGAGIGGFLCVKLGSYWNSKTGQSVSMALASWLSVILASFAVSVELAIDGRISLPTVTMAMVSVHALIGIGEAIITLVFYQLLHARFVTKMSKLQFAAPLSASFVTVFLLSPFASGFPDGLEWVSEQYHFLYKSAPAFVSPMPDSVFPYVTNEVVSTSVAGLFGIAITFFLSWVLFIIFGCLNRERTI